MAEGVSNFQAASSEIVALLQTVEDSEGADATAPKILAATERRDEAEAAIQAAIQGMDPNDEGQARQIEQAYQAVQSANQAVTDAQLEALEREAGSPANQ